MAAAPQDATLREKWHILFHTHAQRQALLQSHDDALTGEGVVVGLQQGLALGVGVEEDVPLLAQGGVLGPPPPPATWSRICRSRSPCSEPANETARNSRFRSAVSYNTISEQEYLQLRPTRRACS